jgi:glycosyltransferase involved in cell wall biosynthesis
MNVLFLQTINPGVCWYRIYQFAQKMSELGLAHCRVFPDFDPKRLMAPDWERKLNENITELEAQADWADIVVCQYINSAEGLSVVQAIRDSRPILMEVDDYFKQVPHQSIAYDCNRPGDGQDLWATRQIMESSGVVVSTPWLAEQYKEFNQNIKCIPNCIDFTHYDHIQPSPHDLIRIGWIGGATHESDLKLVRDVLIVLLAERKDIEVYIVSSPPPSWGEHERLHLIDKWVHIDKYARHVKELAFDIGIAPLKDNLFNRGKSNLRALEYSACGVPTVASWVEPYKNGFPLLYARSEDAWEKNLRYLIDNEQARKEKGKQAYDYVREHYNIENVAVMYADYLKGYI